MAETIPLATLELAHFTPLVGQSFEVRWPEATERLVLQSAEPAIGANDPNRPRVPFNLIFQGTTAGLLLHQHVHPFDHPALGHQEIFLVPIAQDADGTYRYQACFN